MGTVNLAIVSKRRELIRFFELEALNCGFEVSSFDKMPVELSCFDLLIIDTAVTRQPPAIFEGRVIFVTDEENSTPDGVKYLAYPMPIDTLRSIYEQMLYGERAVDRAISRDNEEDRIFFYREHNDTVGYKGRSITLSDHEMKILTRLCECSGEPVSREELNALLGASGGNIADVYVCRLRKKLEDTDGRRVIFTVRSKGYKIVADMEVK
ncbi:MAG: winged helix-turn-helix transcriptional regulator [Clostridia bacterium]|nr:winged helix-turn-helix transcriptional regulator [Clostridia bacterium]